MWSCEPTTGDVVRADAALRRRLEPQLPALGVTRVADLTDLDRVGIPVFGAIRPWSRSLAVTQGKGFHADAAWLGAVMEASELRAAEAPVQAFPDEPQSACAWLPPSMRDFDGPWLPARCWTTGAAYRVPADVVGLDLTRASTLPSWRRTSTGLGAHADRVRAVQHGLLEVIERHALALARAEPRGTCLIAGGRPRCRRLSTAIDRLTALGLAPRFWRLPEVAGLVTVKARLASAAPTSVPVFGSAADADMERAALRALLECIQSRVTRLAGARDDLAVGDYEGEPDATLLEGLPGRRPGASWADAASCRTTAIADSRTLAARLEQAGLGPVLVVDLDAGTPDVHVVKVLVPGLQDSFGKPTLLAA